MSKFLQKETLQKNYSNKNIKISEENHNSDIIELFRKFLSIRQCYEWLISYLHLNYAI